MRFFGFIEAMRWKVQSLRRTALWVSGVTVAVALPVLLITHWNPYKAQHEAFTPLFTLAAGLAVAFVTLMRHFAQTDADRQRRIIESFSKAIEQLSSDKLEVRLGGIYALERISQESSQDYWTVMENLTAFVRERTQRVEAERPRDRRIAECAYLLWEEAQRPEGCSEKFWMMAVYLERHGQGDPPATDIAAVLTVINRRSQKHQMLEIRGRKALDFRQAVMRGAALAGAHLAGADLRGTHLEHADLRGANLAAANLSGAHLEGAILLRAYLGDANLAMAHLEDADLSEAHLDDADLSLANLEEAALDGAHLTFVRGLRQEQIEQASGDAKTWLPAGLSRPVRWLEGPAPGTYGPSADLP